MLEETVLLASLAQTLIKYKIPFTYNNCGNIRTMFTNTKYFVYNGSICVEEYKKNGMLDNAYYSTLSEIESKLQEE